MAASVKASGTQAATIGTEHTLATITDAGVYVAEIDTSAAAAGDWLQISLYGKTLSGGTERLLDRVMVHGARAVPIVRLMPVMAVHSLRLAIKQSEGTGRSFPWSVNAA